MEAHTSANAVYFFIDAKSFYDYNTSTWFSNGHVEDPDKRLARKLIEEGPLLVEIGNSYGLSYRITGSKKHAYITNDLREAYHTCGLRFSEIKQKYPELAKLKGEPIDLNTNLPGRDYAAGKKDKPKTDPAMKQFGQEVLAKSGIGISAGYAEIMSREEVIKYFEGMLDKLVELSREEAIENEVFARCMLLQEWYEASVQLDVRQL